MLKISDWKGKKDFVELSRLQNPSIFLFAAHWCGYCSRFLEIADNYKPVEVTELIVVDTDDPDESLWDEYQIRAVPTLMVIESGRELFRKVALPGIGMRETDLIEAVGYLRSYAKPS